MDKQKDGIQEKIILLRRFWWKLNDNCFKCGVMKIHWGYYSTSTHCPLCEMNLQQIVSRDCINVALILLLSLRK